MEEEKIINLVRENYGLSVDSIEKVKNSYKINSEKKSYFLKVIKYKFKHFNFIISAIIHLQKNNFETIPEILKTVNGRNYIRVDTNYAYLMPWIPSREVNYDNVIELEMATKKLAELHKCSEGFITNLHMKPRVGWFTWINVFETRKDEILDFKYRIQKKSNKSQFDKLYLSCLNEEIERAKKSINVLKESNYLELMIKEYEKKGFCHHDYANHNVLIDRYNNINIIDFDYCMLDTHLHDLASLMIRVMKNGKWDKEKAEEIFKCIPMKMESFYEKFDRECMNIPIFKYYDVYQLFQRISCASNEDIVLIKEKLINRVDKNPKEIEPEMDNIKQLKQVIDDYLKGKDQSIKIVMLKEFSNSLGYIIDKCKSSFFNKKEV